MFSTSVKASLYPLDPPLPRSAAPRVGGGRGAVEGEGGPEGQIVILRLRLLFQSPERRHRTPHA